MFAVIFIAKAKQNNPSRHMASANVSIDSGKEQSSRSHQPQLAQSKRSSAHYDYNDLASRLREKAISAFGCTAFVSATENGREIAISYWPDLESIKRWKADELHLQAQTLGQTIWYENYSVQVCEIRYQYSNDESFDEIGK